VPVAYLLNALSAPWQLGLSINCLRLLLSAFCCLLLLGLLAA
jgi:hypothetical protein